jgi:hypothetical protein
LASATPHWDFAWRFISFLAEWPTRSRTGRYVSLSNRKHALILIVSKTSTAISSARSCREIEAVFFNQLNRSLDNLVSIFFIAPNDLNARRIFRYTHPRGKRFLLWPFTRKLNYAPGRNHRFVQDFASVFFAFIAHGNQI